VIGCPQTKADQSQARCAATPQIRGELAKESGPERNTIPAPPPIPDPTPGPFALAIVATTQVDKTRSSSELVFSFVPVAALAADTDFDSDLNDPVDSACPTIPPPVPMVAQPQIMDSAKTRRRIMRIICWTLVSRFEGRIQSRHWTDLPRKIEARLHQNS